MFRVLMVTVIFLFCSYLGYYFGNIFKSRSNEIKELHKGILLLNSEVIYSNTAIPKALSNVSPKLANPISEIFNDISHFLECGEYGSVFETYKNVYEMHKDNIHLKESDINILDDFFRAFGESAIYGQEKIIELTLDNLNNNLKEAYDEFRTNTKMYRTLGICTGAIIAIFFI